MTRSLILDLVVLSALVVACWRGWSRRSIREAFSLIGLALGITLVAVATGPTSALVRAVSPAGADVSRAIAAGTLLALSFAAGAIAGFRVARTTTIPGPRRWDAVGGVSFALARALSVISLVLLCLDVTWAPTSVGHRMISDSASGRLLTGNDSPFGAFYGSVIDSNDDLRALRTWARRNEEVTVGYLQSELRATDEKLVAAPNEERAMLRAVNQERRSRGLPPLRWCEPCAVVARAHSKDMYRDGYFSHEDLDGDDPFDRMIEAEISYGAAGENLALAPTVDEAHNGLMESVDHRANILRAAFDEVGIGIYDGPYGLMCTQVFRALP